MRDTGKVGLAPLPYAVLCTVVGVPVMILCMVVVIVVLIITFPCAPFYFYKKRTKEIARQYGIPDHTKS